jgi:hypothetical protein
MKFLISKIFVKSFSEPRILLLSSIENISESITKPLELKLHDLRRTKIKSQYFKFNGKMVNWNNWRQFNSNENDNKKRKVVFDEFIKKTKYISPVINLRFKRIREIYSSFSDKINERSKRTFSPLDGYLISEKITFPELKSLVSEMGQRAGICFLSDLNCGKELIGK